MTPALHEALEAYKPEIAARYEAIARNRFERMVADLGPSLRGVCNSWTWAKVWNGTVRAIVRNVGGNRPGTEAYEIDGQRLAAAATRYADATVATWASKIEAKLGEMEGAEVHRLDACTFNLTGAKAGRRVRVEQSIIVNCSPKGTVFNQFPARIYLDGKFVSEAKFKKMGWA